MAYLVNSKKRLYFWEGIHWEENYDINHNPDPVAHCPKQKCNCILRKSKEPYALGEYKYFCIKCGYKITLNKSIEEKGIDFMDVFLSQEYKNAEIVNIDGELIRIQKQEQRDNDYWIEAKLSKNKKGQVQLMILAGSKKQKDKTQLFLDPSTERLAFDQNNDHPRKIFTKVTATFKNSKSEITDKNN